jgi:hypothetical protein
VVRNNAGTRVRRFRRTAERRAVGSKLYPCTYLITTSTLAPVPQTAGRSQSLLTTIRFVHEMCDLQPSGSYQHVSTAGDRPICHTRNTPAVPAPFFLDVRRQHRLRRVRIRGKRVKKLPPSLAVEKHRGCVVFIFSDRDAKQSPASFSTPEERASRLWNRPGPHPNSKQRQRGTQPIMGGRFPLSLGRLKSRRVVCGFWIHDVGCQ